LFHLIALYEKLVETAFSTITVIKCSINEEECLASILYLITAYICGWIGHDESKPVTVEIRP
jgi:hypothetical protein